MKLAAWILIPLMGIAIALLALNLRERDFYEHGTPEDADGITAPSHAVAPHDTFLSPLLPEAFVHACATRKDCRHPIELEDAKRQLWIHDTDGWYRLFWSVDDLYRFEDPLHLAEAMRNPTAEAPGGLITLTLRVGPADHAEEGNLVCDEIPRKYSMHYFLRYGEEPVDPEEAPREDYSGLPFMKTAPAFTYRYEDLDYRPHFLYYYWVLDASSFKILSATPCACGKH